MNLRSSSLVLAVITTGALAACHPVSGGGGTTGSGGSATSTSAGEGGSASGVGSTSGSGGAAPGRAFALVGAYWTGSAEAVDRIDPVTGTGTFLGNLGDLQLWSTQLVLDRDATHVYAVGLSPTSASTLYVLDLAAGTSTQTPIAESYTLGGVTDDGHAIGIHWTGSAEAVDLVDPVTGSSTFVGNLGDLQTWSLQTAYDRDAHVLHALGNDAAMASRIYSLSLDTHASAKVAVASDYFLGGVTATGTLLGATWTGSVERVDVIAPALGVGIAQGQLDDLGAWTNAAFTVDAAAGVAYASGYTAAKEQKFYTLELATGVSTGVATAIDYVLARP
jgi:hypothetical protein